MIDLEITCASRSRDVAPVAFERRALPEAPITASVMGQPVEWVARAGSLD